MIHLSKKSSRNMLDNNMPVTLSSVVKKLLGKIPRDRIYLHLESQRLTNFSRVLKRRIGGFRFKIIGRYKKDYIF